MRFSAILTCDKGLEEISIDEVKKLIHKDSYVYHPGAIYVKDITEEDIFKLNFLSRTIHRVIILLMEGEFESLTELKKKVSDIDFENYIKYDQTFAVECERTGKHDFTSLDVEKIIGKIIIERHFLKVGNRLLVNLKNPDILVRVRIRHKKFWVGLDTTGIESL